MSLLNLGKVLAAAFTCRDQSTEVWISKNYETYKHRYKLCHINQTGQSTTWKETYIEFKKYIEIVCFEQTSTKYTEIFAP